MESYSSVEVREKVVSNDCDGEDDILGPVYIDPALDIEKRKAVNKNYSKELVNLLLKNSDQYK